MSCSSVPFLLLSLPFPLQVTTFFEAEQQREEGAGEMDRLSAASLPRCLHGQDCAGPKPGASNAIWVSLGWRHPLPPKHFAGHWMGAEGDLIPDLRGIQALRQALSPLQRNTHSGLYCLVKMIREADQQRSGGRAGGSPSCGSQPRGPQQLGLGQAEPGHRNSVLISHRSGRVPGTWAVLTA